MILIENTVLLSNAGSLSNINGSYFNEKIQNDIESHFEKEIELKKKLYELENNNQSVNEQLNKLNTDKLLKSCDDKNLKEKIFQLKENQRSNLQMIDFLQQDYNSLFAKRVVISNVTIFFIIM